MTAKLAFFFDKNVGYLPDFSPTFFFFANFATEISKHPYYYRKSFLAMKHTITLAVALCASLIGFAQDVKEAADSIHTEATDSISSEADAAMSHELQEVVIEAPRVIHKADMDMFYPSTSAVEQSQNGMQLLRNLRIPSLSVNEVMGTITTTGESVQVRINGREATIEQVKTLLPETIKRVEWMDNPGLRYKGAVAVLNFIVINPTVGGSFMFDGMQALNCAWGQESAALKLNNGHSQWGASVNNKLTNRVGCYREYSETFTYADGESLTRTESPRDGFTCNNFSSLQLDYSYIKPDTTTFWIAVHGYKLWEDKSLSDGIMSQSNGNNDIHLRDYNRENGFTPSMKAYLEQHFAHNQILAVDFNASFYDGYSARTYTENDNVTSALLNDVYTSIKDHNQAYGIEADYIKKWKNSRLTAGISYNANRNRSTYENLGGEIFHQRKDDVYFFGEYFYRIKKVTLSAGLGAQYTDFKFRETGQGNNSWNLRPQFSASYKYNAASMFSLNFTSWQTAPSLTQTNIAATQTDGIQWSIGNPNLQTASNYMLNLRYKYTSERVSGTFSIRAFDSPDAIAPYLYWQDNRLITSYENSKGLKSISFTLSPEIDIIPNWLTFTGNISYRLEQSKGNGYQHTNKNLSWFAMANISHWGFSLIAQYEKAPKRLSGETYKWGETLSVLMLSYNWRDWEFGVGMLCPFNKYDTGSQSLNRYNSNVSHMRLDMSAMPLISISYNLQWGHQKRGVNKMVNTSSHIETSSAGGR
jgi:hypothetical protein